MIVFLLLEDICAQRKNKFVALLKNRMSTKEAVVKRSGFVLSMRNSKRYRVNLWKRNWLVKFKSEN